MKALADAIVYAVTYIDLWDDRDEDYLDDDVGALESIAASLHGATEQEKDALAAAADRALADEKAAARPRKKFVDSYKAWMENMFGDDDWKGNKRTKKAGRRKPKT